MIQRQEIAKISRFPCCRIAGSSLTDSQQISNTALLAQLVVNSLPETPVKDFHWRRIVTSIHDLEERLRGRSEEPELNEEEKGVSIGHKQELGIWLPLSDAKFPFKLSRQVVPDR